MTTLTIEVPDSLLAKVTRQNRPIQEVVVTLLEDAFEKEVEPAAPLAATCERMIQGLVSAGLIREPGMWDSPAAKEWRNLSAAEKRRHLEERKAMRFLGSPGATAVLEGRR